jgi:hypothetical protein
MVLSASWRWCLFLVIILISASWAVTLPLILSISIFVPVIAGTFRLPVLVPIP